MKVILETERLILREMDLNDYDDLCKILQDSEAMYAYEHAFTDEEVHNWLNRQIESYKKNGFGLWAVMLKETSTFIGQVGLTYQDVEGRKELEIGYLLIRKYWHKGYATEAAIACKEYAFNHINKNRVVTIIRDTNYASQRVAERVGMKIEGRFTKHYYDIDMPHYVYVIENRNIYVAKCDGSNT